MTTLHSLLEVAPQTTQDAGVSGGLPALCSLYTVHMTHNALVGNKNKNSFRFDSTRQCIENKFCFLIVLDDDVKETKRRHVWFWAMSCVNG